ncbi:MAG: hypothetical protein RLZZ215_1033 [Pseudomonadota bacterium]|jgi:hypothetical protein
MKLLFRIALLGLGVWLLIMGWQTAYYPIYYRLMGTVVEGEVIGFLAGRYSPSIQPENIAIRNGHRIARRPAYKYPATVGGSPTLIGKANGAFTFSFYPFELGEKVTVVFPAAHSEQSYLFAASTIMGGLLFMGFGLLCVYIGVGGKL